jgi:hypothetical protein
MGIINIGCLALLDLITLIPRYHLPQRNLLSASMSEMPLRGLVYLRSNSWNRIQEFCGRSASSLVFADEDTNVQSLVLSILALVCSATLRPTGYFVMPQDHLIIAVGIIPFLPLNQSHSPTSASPHPRPRCPPSPHLLHRVLASFPSPCPPHSPALPW